MGKGIPGEVTMYGKSEGTGETSGVARARRVGRVMRVDADRVGLLLVREARPGVLPKLCIYGLCKLRPGQSE